VTAINASVDLTLHGDVALIVMTNAPVNALKHELRQGIADALMQVRTMSAVRAVVLAGNDRTFSAGADITEFGKPPLSPILPDLITLIENFPIPVVAAIKGVAMGGGLGLLPGAGGTQRLPRLIGFTAAVETIVTGDPVSMDLARHEGLIDAMMEGPYPTAAVDWARNIPVSPLPRAREKSSRLAEAQGDNGLIDRVAAPLVRKAQAKEAALACVEAIRNAAKLPFDEGLALERKLFLQLLSSEESRALRYVFSSEREAQKVPGLAKNAVSRTIERVAVIGAGTMGGGISMCFANAGIPVTIVETSQSQLDAGMGRIAKNYETSVKRGSLAADESARRMTRIVGATSLDAAADADMVIEAVFEEMDLKKRIFADLDRIAKPGAILATNTSYLDVNEIAAVTSRLGDVLGTHFFSPANVMRLLEVVRGAKTAPDVLATVIEVGRKIGKVPVVVGVCDGFVGNRMLARRSAQAERLLLEGALPHEVDRALTDFGFRMGPFAMGDLAGLDIGWRLRKARGLKAAVSDALCEAGRLGQKTGKGYYAYGDGGRTPSPDPEVEALIVAASARAGIARRAIGQDEILERLLYPMVNEGARILEEGIAARALDIDVIWLNGYGWPANKGGPMYFADTIGLDKIAARLNVYADAVGEATLRPSALLSRLAAAGTGFKQFAIDPAAQRGGT
jgi:3-hydroxyacyl-CoA dehydrogenase